MSGIRTHKLARYRPLRYGIFGTDVASGTARMVILSYAIATHCYASVWYNRTGSCALCTCYSMPSTDGGCDPTT